MNILLCWVLGSGNPPSFNLSASCRNTVSGIESKTSTPFFFIILKIRHPVWSEWYSSDRHDQIPVYCNEEAISLVYHPRNLYTAERFFSVLNPFGKYFNLRSRKAAWRLSSKQWNHGRGTRLYPGLHHCTHPAGNKATSGSLVVMARRRRIRLKF